MTNFKPLEEAPNPCIIVAGLEASRKTTFAMTATGPIYVIGTEEGHERDTIFRHKGDKEVYITELVHQKPDKYQPIWFGAYAGLWDQVVHATKELSDELTESGTVIIDSASDLFGMAAANFNQAFERGSKPIPPMMYGQVYPMLRAEINRLRRQHTVIMTCRLKPERNGEHVTGNMILNIWNDGEYLAEHILYMSVDEPTQEGIAHGSRGSAAGAVIVNPTYEKIFEKDMWFGNDDAELYKAIKAVGSAYTYLDYNKIAYEKRSCTTLDEYTAYVNELRALANPTQVAVGQPSTTAPTT